MIVLDYPQGSEDWLRARCGACTASRFRDARQRVGALTEQQAVYVAALQRGLSERSAQAEAGYKSKPTAAAIDRALTGQQVSTPGASALNYAALIAMETIAREPLDDTFVTWAMRRGREFEPLARAAYERRTKNWVMEASLILTDEGHYGYSTDGLVDDEGLIEIKVPLSAEKLVNVWANPDEAHLEYLDQIEGGLWITGRKWCDLVIYCPWLAPVDKDLFVKRIYRNEDRIETLESELVEFWSLVEANLTMLRTPAKMSGRPVVEAAPLADPMTPPWDMPATPAPSSIPIPKPAPRLAQPALVDNPF